MPFQSAHKGQILNAVLSRQGDSIVIGILIAVLIVNDHIIEGQKNARSVAASISARQVKLWN